MLKKLIMKYESPLYAIEYVNRALDGDAKEFLRAWAEGEYSDDFFEWCRNNTLGDLIAKRDTARDAITRAQAIDETIDKIIALKVWSFNAASDGNRIYIAEDAILDLKTTGESNNPTGENKMNEEQIKYMVDRFLQWKLPEDFHPDCGISFDAGAAQKLNPRNMYYVPIGTNLFTATQAKEMVKFMLDGLPK